MAVDVRTRKDSSSRAYTLFAFGHRQRIYLATDLVLYLSKHRQLESSDREAGGQLFGTVKNSEVRVLVATGPYQKDTRSRHSYRSDPKSAQAAIDGNAEFGLNYIGEWHTHPEPVPTPSGEDLRTIGKLHGKSSLRLSTVMLLIQGTEQAPSGITVRSFDGSNWLSWEPLPK